MDLVFAFICVHRENIYFVAPNNGIELGTSVRFHSYKINPPNNTNASFTENNDNENINNNINIQEITYRFPVKESNRNLFSRLKSSIALTNSKSEINRASFLNDNNDYRQLRLKRNRKAARMLGLLVAAFLICW